jgi:hypothetical protein
MSTFDTARQFVSWAREIDGRQPPSNDEVLPLCAGPLKKLIGICQTSLRPADSIQSAVKARESKIRRSQISDSSKLNGAKLEAEKLLGDATERQNHLNEKIGALLAEIRERESAECRQRDDHEAYSLQKSVVREIFSTRKKELDHWSRVTREVQDVSAVPALENGIDAVKSSCRSALAAVDSSVRAPAISTASDGTLDEESSPASVRHSEADLQALVVSEYLAANKLVHAMKTRGKEKNFVGADEDKDVFRNSLMLELAMAERASLRQTVAELEMTVSTMASAPSDLEKENGASKELKLRSAALKRQIAEQARRNVMMDKRLREVTNS